MLKMAPFRPAEHFCGRTPGGGTDIIGVENRMARSGTLLHRFAPIDAMAWLLGAVDGLLTSITTPASIRRQQTRHRFVQQWHGWVRRMIAITPDEASVDLPAEPVLRQLRQLLLGRTRGQVISLLGPPPATSTQPHPEARAPYWHADTWYYPSTGARPAIAISFEQEKASGIDPLMGRR
jgi:hypothetical protein